MELSSIPAPTFVHVRLLSLPANIDQVTGGVVRDARTHEHHLGELQACLCRLRNDMVGAQRDQAFGVVEILGAGINSQSRPIPARSSDHALGGIRVVHRHHKRDCPLATQLSQYLRLARIAVEDGAAPRVETGNQARVSVKRNVR